MLPNDVAWHSSGRESLTNAPATGPFWRSTPSKYTVYLAKGSTVSEQIYDPVLHNANEVSTLHEDSFEMYRDGRDVNVQDVNVTRWIIHFVILRSFTFPLSTSFVLK
jgi:hypothetical protein